MISFRVFFALFLFLIPFMTPLDLSASPSVPFMLESATFQEGDSLPHSTVFNGFGCSGGNRSPALHWYNAPQGTKSFALTVYDPDAPTGSGWWHWTLFNIPKHVTRLPEGANQTGMLPKEAREGRTDFGTVGYGGACPPAGKPHRYIFTIHALDIENLDLDSNASGAMVGFYLAQHALATASLTGLYGR